MRLFFLASALLAPAFASAQIEPTRPDPGMQIRLCVPDMEVPPYSHDKGRQGTVPQLLRMAADKAATSISSQTLPLRRCHELLRQGLVDASLISYSAEAASAFRFPDDAGPANNPPAQLAALRVKLYRLRNSPANWDGRQFFHAMRVGVQHDTILVRRLLSELPIQVDYNNFTAQQQVDKLLAGRFDLLLGLSDQLDPIVSSSGLSDKIEALAEPFITAHVYLAFSPQFVESSGTVAQTMWRAIADLNRAGVMQRLLRDPQHQPAGLAK